MDTVRIIHLSDLHFTAKKDLKIWSEVVRFINEDVRLHAILITGDVTDNATSSDFEVAQKNLDLLTVKKHQAGRPKYRIVPGNHDRYEFLGNRIGGSEKNGLTNVRSSRRLSATGKS